MANVTSTYAIDNSQDWNVVVQSRYCRRVVITEDYNSQTPPTVDLLQKQSDDPNASYSSVPAVNIPKGTPAIYTNLNPALYNGSFYPGQIVGTIRVQSTGGITSCTVKQIESFEI